MDVLSLLIGVAVLGFVVWLLTTYVPMPAPFRQGLIVLVVIIIIVWLVRVLVGPIYLPVAR